MDDKRIRILESQVKALEESLDATRAEQVILRSDIEAAGLAVLNLLKKLKSAYII